jgi:hypothetical protein
MIVVRDVFRLRFGKARDATAAWKEGAGFLKRAGISARILTDLVGPSYTLVLESSHESLAGLEAGLKQVMSDPKWREWYQTFVPLVEEGYREIFTVAE